MRLQSLACPPVFTHPCLMPTMSTIATLIGFTMTSRTVRSWLGGKVLIVLHFHTMTRMHPAFTLAMEHWHKSRSNFASVGTYSRSPDRHVFEKFPKPQQRPLLIIVQGLLSRCPACLLCDGASARLNGVTHIALTNKFEKTLLPLDLPDVDTGIVFALKGIHFWSHKNRTGAECFLFYCTRLLYCPDQMLAEIMLIQH